jgi:hypothetical protein
MVGSPLLAAGPAVDVDGVQPVGGLWREQQVVDAQTIVLLPGAALIVPIAVAVRLVVQGAVGLGVAQVEQDPKTPPGLRLAQGVVGEGGRIIDIVVGRADVVVAAEDDRQTL